MYAAALLFALPVSLGEPQVEWSAPDLYVEGGSFHVELTITAPEEGAPIAGWMLTPSAFTIDGKPLSEREVTQTVPLQAGASLTLSYDLAPAMAASGLIGAEGFELTYAKEYIEVPPAKVDVLQPAREGLDFMEMPLEELGEWWVVIQTNQGPMVAEFWPDVAPNHVRNFLDLSYTGFYDGLTFHRVIRNFMIQGGDPQGTGVGSGPRTVDAEFSQKRHVPGVLSMARLGHDVNSATCQFFIVHANAPNLDGNYSAFGQLVRGLDVLNAIATTPVERTPNGQMSKPVETQVMNHVIVVRKPAGR